MRRLWESLLAKNRSVTRRTAVSAACALLGFGLAFDLFRSTGFYFTFVIIVTVIVIALYAGGALAVGFAVMLSLAADYEFIPPVGRVLELACGPGAFRDHRLDRGHGRVCGFVGPHGVPRDDGGQARSRDRDAGGRRRLERHGADPRARRARRPQPARHGQNGAGRPGRSRVERAVARGPRDDAAQPRASGLDDPIAARRREHPRRTHAADRAPRVRLVRGAPPHGRGARRRRPHQSRDRRPHSGRVGDRRTAPRPAEPRRERAQIRHAGLASRRAPATRRRHGPLVRSQRRPADPGGRSARDLRPFRRTTDSVASGRRGWGLGLAIVRAVAEAHGGHASVESTEASGTTFTLAMPLRAREGAQRPAARRSLQPRSTS